MATQRFTRRPEVIDGLQWLGGNFSELYYFASVWAVDNGTVDNNDGTVNWGYNDNLPVGSWVFQDGTVSGSDVLEEFQPVDHTGRYSYDIRS